LSAKFFGSTADGVEFLTVLLDGTIDRLPVDLNRGMGTGGSNSEQMAWWFSRSL